MDCCYFRIGEKHPLFLRDKLNTALVSYIQIDWFGVNYQVLKSTQSFFYQPCTIIIEHERSKKPLAFKGILKMFIQRRDD